MTNEDQPTAQYQREFLSSMLSQKDDEIERLKCENKYLLEKFYPLLDALRDLPDLPTPDVLLTLSHSAKYPEDWNTGKRLQRERGLDVVPPKTECELGAGWWHRVVGPMTKKIDMGDGDRDVLEKLEGAYALAMEGYGGRLRPYDYLIEAKQEIERLREEVERLSQTPAEGPPS